MLGANRTVVIVVNVYAPTCKRKIIRVEVIIKEIILTTKFTFCKKECVVKV